MKTQGFPFYCNVIVPGPWWNTLTYGLSSQMSRGSRLKVPVGKGSRYGIVDSFLPLPPADVKYTLRQAESLSDSSPLISDKGVDLFQWTGKTFLCGAGEILKIAVPPAVLSSSSPFEGFADCRDQGPGYEERFLYDCRTDLRWSRIIDSLDVEYPFLVLFPEQALAAAFFELLPSYAKTASLLWPSTGGKKLHDAWIAARKGTIRSVIGGPGAIFAPLSGIRSIIVDEESSGAYRTYRRPFLNIRTVAARKAFIEKAVLTLSGRLPSSRAYLRGKPRCVQRPDRDAVKFVDIRKSLASEYQGISGTLPLSAALFSETEKSLSAGKVVLWLLDRKGYAGEVACEECGRPILCSSCGRVMAWEEGKQRLRCSACGRISPLPEICPSCRGVLLKGKRPGLEALLPVAKAAFPADKPVFIWDGTKSAGKKKAQTLKKSLAGGGIVLGTRSALALCDIADVGFAAWLDADSEVRNIAFQAKFTAYSMIWESFWRGNPGEGRSVLLQSRRPGSGWQKGMVLGWDSFWNEELRERKELGLPPFSFLLEIRSPSLTMKESIMARLEETGLSPMDPGEPAVSFWVAIPNPGRVYGALAPFYSITNSRIGFPEITVWID